MFVDLNDKFCPANMKSNKFVQDWILTCVLTFFSLQMEN